MCNGLQGTVKLTSCDYVLNDDDFIVRTDVGVSLLCELCCNSGISTSFFKSVLIDTPDEVVSR